MPESDQLLDTLLDAWRAGNGPPNELVGTVPMRDAYNMQLQLLDREVAAGRTHRGWKVGQTAASMRAERGEAEPAPGFLIGDADRSASPKLDIEGQSDWHLEPELALTLGTPLGAEEVTPEAAFEAVATACSAFELVHRKAGWEDRALQRSVNGTTSGFILGPQSERVPTPDEIDDARVIYARNDTRVGDLRGGDINDNPFQTLAWLATFLHRHGRRLEPGQVVLTGTYAGLVRITSGEHWQATIGSLDPVTLRT